VPMKVAMMAAFLITLPYTLYQIWAFVAPGLYSNERRLVFPLVFVSSILFFCGMAFSFFWCVATGVRIHYAFCTAGRSGNDRYW